MGFRGLGLGLGVQVVGVWLYMFGLGLQHQQSFKNLSPEPSFLNSKPEMQKPKP